MQWTYHFNIYDKYEWLYIYILQVEKWDQINTSINKYKTIINESWYIYNKYLYFNILIELAQG